ncbi:MAG: hypothetical protein ACYYK0_00265 [Candidatus Eutrophobiaceae bacterium]
MKMQKNCCFVATKASICIALFLALPTQAGIKCWTNNDGIRECGTSVPPEYVQKGHKEYSEQGSTVREVNRAPTEEEIQEEAKRKRELWEKERIAKEKLDAKNKGDKALLDTFNAVSDLERSRDEKLSELASQIRFLKERNEKLDQKYQAALKDASETEELNEKLPENLKATLESLRNQLKNNNDSINSYAKQEEGMKQKYAQDIQRFKELKNLK